jgi:hypothetical protein
VYPSERGPGAGGLHREPPYRWHVRAAGGATWLDGMGQASGAEATFGLDLGGTWRNGLCWDVSWRTHEVGRQTTRLQNPSQPPDPIFNPQIVTMESGRLHQLGLKAGWESPRGPGDRRPGAFAMAGPEAWWTDGLTDDDSGFGVQAEAGVLWRAGRDAVLRAGVAVHGADTDFAGGSFWTVGPFVALEVRR